MDDSDTWLALMQAVSYESGASVVSVSQYLHGGEYPSDFPFELPADCHRVLARGNS